MEGSRSRFGVEGVVRFRCRPGLQLVGSAERRCLEGGAWSGSDPRCRVPMDPYGSLWVWGLSRGSQEVPGGPGAVSGVSRGSHGGPAPPDPTEKRRIRLDAGAALNIFLVLDSSRSVSRSDYESARRALSELVETVGT
ncbi:CFAB factor, partial [Origma solitaria]|nr:CFAB factor [Origma solitaria]